MSFSIEITFLFLFLLQLFLSIFIIWMNINQEKFRFDNMPVKNQEKDPTLEVFTMNCKKYFLTSREVEILRLIRDGLPYKLIAGQLNISENTVGTHVKNMFTKVDVTNKMELVSRMSN